jgi:ABC-type glycerol-3-phosphate transport system substrate-binding protein
MMSKNARRAGWVWLFLCILLSVSGCTGLRSIDLPFLNAAPTMQPSPQPGATPSATPQIQVTPTDTEPAPSSLTVWIPPEFASGENDRAGVLLKSHLDEFARANRIQLDIRLKSTSGASNLLESLTATYDVAPMALPGVIALPRSDLENAALKGLVYPMDGLSTLIDDKDWYDYARQLAMVQGVTFGLPFAGDGLVMVYRPAKVITPPATWEAALKLSQPVALPAGSQQGLVTMALYRSVGGEVEDAQRRPTLQADRLSKVLDLYKQGVDRNIFPIWMAQYETDGQVWQAFQEGRVNAAIAWSSSFLNNPPPDSSALPLPSMGSAPSTLATGWVWAVADPLPARRALSVKLAEWLVDPTFLAEWSEAAGYLPTRPSVMAAWKDQTLKGIFSQVALSAQARPSNDLITSLGPVLKEAVVKIIRKEADPTQAAGAAAEQLNSSRSR